MAGEEIGVSGTMKKVLYHGTDRPFNVFNFQYAKGFKDFGRGFYLTTSLRQAQKWAQNRAREKSVAYIYEYSLSIDSLQQMSVLELLQYNEQWLDFITESRMRGTETDYDVIYDKMADNQYPALADTLRKYDAGQITAKEAISQIRWVNDTGDQYCFKNEHAVSLLKRERVLLLQKDRDNLWRMEKE